MKKGVSLILVISILMIVVCNVSALESAAQPEKKAEVVVTDIAGAVNLLDDYVSRSADETFVLEAPKAILSRVAPDVLAQVRENMVLVNQTILAQGLKTTDSLLVLSTVTTAPAVALATGIFVIMFFL